MSDREEFEKWILEDMEGVPLERSSENGAYLAPCLNRIWRTWQARQREIDALKEELNLCHGTLESRERNIADLMKENAALKAENERLRKALPLTPEAVIAFIGHNFNSIEPVDEEGRPQGHLDCVQYSLTVHDLLSAFSDIDAAMKEMK